MRSRGGVAGYHGGGGAAAGSGAEGSPRGAQHLRSPYSTTPRTDSSRARGSSGEQIERRAGGGRRREGLDRLGKVLGSAGKIEEGV
jgi:hypothetical protein